MQVCVSVSCLDKKWSTILVNLKLNISYYYSLCSSILSSTHDVNEILDGSNVDLYI